jgi:hypothetical protein
MVDCYRSVFIQRKICGLINACRRLRPTHPSRPRYIIPLSTSKTANSARRTANARANCHIPKAFLIAVSRGNTAKASASKRVAKVAAKGAGALGLDV